MPIDVVCQCGRKASVPDAMAGKKGKCPACGEILSIPVAAVMAPAKSGPNPPGTIEAHCPVCDRKFLVSDTVAGRSWKCKCGEMVAIPMPAASGPDSTVEAGSLPPIATPPAAIPASYPKGDTAATPTRIDVRCRCGQAHIINPDAPPKECFYCGRVMGPTRYFVYPETIQRVHLVEADMPFGSMCWFMFKWTFAAIPTMILLGFVYWVVLTIIQSTAPTHRLF